MAKLEAFYQGQRVMIVESEFKNLLGLVGTVERPRICDNGAWVDVFGLPEEHKSFDDQRANHLLLYPGECEQA